MNKKLIFPFAIFFISITVLFAACGKTISTTSNDTSTEFINKNEEKLPADFTIDNIKSAFKEYINYRLWLYPEEVQDGTSDKDFDNYIGKSIDVEIRLYKEEANKVYAHTNLGDWLAVFNSHKGFIYCEGQASSKDEDNQYPKANDYAVIDKYSLEIPKPIKPNYGTSENKDKMIAVAISNIKSSCEEFYKTEKEWENVDVYIADFYEYESGLHAWLCKQDGTITNYPLMFKEKNNDITVKPVKGFNMKSKDEFNEFGLFQFERDISDAVKHFKCNQK